MKRTSLSKNSQVLEGDVISDSSPPTSSTTYHPVNRPMPSLSSEPTERRPPAMLGQGSLANDLSDLQQQQSPDSPSSPTLRETAGSPGALINGTAPGNAQTIRDSSWLELEVCREYLRGSCTREDCRFVHPSGSVLTKDGKVTCCFDYLKDRCTRERCKYLHPPPSIKERLIQAGKQYGHAMALATQPPKTALTAIPPLPVGSALAMPLPVGAMGYPPASSSYAMSLPGSPVSGGVVNKLDICRDFDRGRCVRGERCHFAHPEPYVRRNPDSTVTVCWNFTQGFCRHEQCWYFHPPPHIVALFTLMPPPVSSPLLPQPLLLPHPILGLPPISQLPSPVTPPINLPPPVPMPHGVGVGPMVSPVVPVTGVLPLIPPGHPAPINLLSVPEV